MASSSGMRISEILQLTSKDLDMDHTVKMTVGGETIDIFHLALQFFEKTCSPHYHWERNHKQEPTTDKQKRYLIG